MNARIILLTSAMLTTGCGSSDDKISEVQYDMSIRGSTDAAEFIIRCAEAANPLSDEEGEDLVVQCERTASNIYGVPYFHVMRGWRKLCESEIKKETEDCKVGLL
jgi:hypothetical protein